ncbi:hypothetical protein PZF67_005276 [Pseudomonas aeruginosa]|uniref:hypothetical protein n=1 Tax=Pseudomonas aeruginosa TaxID=287 RepID=UPI00155F186F|nr:hypothetical protein [Pseudomonas aeruginosa]EKW9640257.1 hypothetical protein [Pseudomonas aeruginosa]NRC33974.1 hypothetical protein [Pseudomonas aeruginosa]
MTSSNPFNALCWVNQTTFPVDLEKGLVALGAPAEIARDISAAYQLTSDRNLMRFYEEYAYATNDADWQKYLCAFLTQRMAQYQLTTSDDDQDLNSSGNEHEDPNLPEITDPELIQVPSSADSYGFGYVDGTDLSSLRLYRDHLVAILDSLPEGPLVTADKYQQDITLLNKLADEAHAQMQEAFTERDEVISRHEGDGTTSNKYKAELYDEVWQKARVLGFSNVTMALDVLHKVSVNPELLEAARKAYARLKSRTSTDSGEAINIADHCDMQAFEDFFGKAPNETPA